MNNTKEMKKKQMQMEVENKPITMRSTFIIGKDGKLVKEMRDIDIKGHPPNSGCPFFMPSLKYK